MVTSVTSYSSPYLQSPSLSSIPLPLLSSSANLGCMDRVLFKELLHSTFRIVTEDVLMDRIFNAFDKRNDGVIGIDEWISGLSVFLRGTLDERISFSFFVYDLNGDGIISKDEIFALLRNSVLRLPQDEDPDDSIKDLADLTFKKFDQNGDGKISWEDYCHTIQKDSLLLEALGQCFPPHEICQHFFSSLGTSLPHCEQITDDGIRLLGTYLCTSEYLTVRIK